MRPETRSPMKQFVISLLVASAVSEILFVYSAMQHHSLVFDYLSINLGLAWIPLIFAWRLTKILKTKLWSSWEALGLSVLWLVFLPNSFYMISDYIHLQDVSQNNINYDAIMLTSFIFTAVILGFSSLYLVHLHLKRRLDSVTAASWIATVLFVCSIAIYFGRDLRWSSWNILTNPGGLLIDFLDRVRHLSSYPDMITTVLAFFVLLSTFYNLLWKAVYLLQINTLSNKPNIIK